MNLNREIYAELRSFDSVLNFPNNNAASFRVQFDQEILLEGLWELALKAITIECSTGDRFLPEIICTFTQILLTFHLLAGV